jgi:hypothetical protein
MKKRIFSVILVVLIICTLTACGDTNTAVSTNRPNSPTQNQASSTNPPEVSSSPANSTGRNPIVPDYENDHEYFDLIALSDRHYFTARERYSSEVAIGILDLMQENGYLITVLDSAGGNNPTNWNVHEILFVKRGYLNSGEYISTNIGFSAGSQLSFCGYSYPNEDRFPVRNNFSYYSDYATAEANFNSALTFDDMMPEALIIAQNALNVFSDVDQSTLKDDIENINSGTNFYLVYSLR